jgi:CDP-glucose 4,6-dehydratase
VGEVAGRAMRGSVLVTGAGGFIASRLALSLVEDGWSVVVLERDAPRVSGLDLWDLRSRAHVVRGDVRDGETVRRVLAEYDVRSVFHLAAQVLVGVASRSPESTLDSNIRGTWTLLEACRTTGDIESIVVASSDKAYGSQPELPYTESAPLGALFPYDASKACADILARSYATTFGMPVVVTRFANIYGPGDMNLSRLVPEVALAAARGEAPVIRSDGSPERDYLYIADCVRAYRLLGRHAAEEGVRGEAFNVGTGVPVSVLDLVRAALRAAGHAEIEPVVEGSARHEIDRQYLDSSRIASRLGFRPEWSLDEGLRETVAWYREHLDLFPRPLGDAP